MNGIYNAASVGAGNRRRDGDRGRHMISMECTNIFLFIIIHNASREGDEE